MTPEQILGPLVIISCIFFIAAIWGITSDILEDRKQNKVKKKEKITP